MMHPAKQIFVQISLILQISELDCYTLYLDTALDFRLDFSVLADQSKTDESLAEQLYGDKNKPPRFFNYLSYSDWSRLSNNLLPSNEGLCFYLERFDLKNPLASSYVKIFDDSTITKLFNPNVPIVRHVFVIRRYKSQKFSENLLYFPSCNLTLYPAISEYNFMLLRSESSPDLISCLNTVIQNAISVPFSLPNISFDELTSNELLFTSLKCPVILCTHIGDVSSVSDLCKKTLKPNFGNQEYSILAIFNERSANEPLILCISLSEGCDKFVVYQPLNLLGFEISKSNSSGNGRITDVNNFMKNVAERTAGPKATSDPQKDLKSKTSLKDFVKDWWERYPCRCDPCTLGKEEYSKNISLYGPQKRTSMFLDITEYLKIFDLETEDNLENLSIVYDLSIAAVDLESFTKKIKKNRISKIKSISKIADRNKVIAVQEMSLIGYGDTFIGSKPHIKIFEIIPGVRSAKKTVEVFVDYVLHRQKLILATKTKLLQPLFDFVNKYREAHYEFWLCEYRNAPDPIEAHKNVKYSYDNSLVGCFEKHLKKLAASFNVQAFNGSRYDYVLLHRFMATALKKRGLVKPFHLIKRDSRIMRLSIPRKGVTFCDILDLLGPGGSLSSFATLVNLDEQKMLFPFSAFTDLSFLDQKTLPTDKEAWFNELQQQYVSDEDIAKAHNDFKKVGAKNIGDYLKKYLIMDVKLLGYGVVKYFNSLYERYKIHPISIFKSTLSSYGAYLYQNNLMQNKRIAHFSPNYLPLYGNLKSAATGGLTLVCRHSADGSDPNEDPINSHLSADHNIPGKCVIVYDVNSLYPSSTLFTLPFGPGIFLVKCKYNDNLIVIRNHDNHSQKLMNCCESQVVQYLTLVKYSSCIRAYSQFHAGPGQVVFSRSHKKRVDLCLVMKPGTLKIIQYHDAGSHVNNKGSHAENCQYHQPGVPLDTNMETVVSDDQNLRFAKWLTEKVPGLTVTYEVFNECDFFHGNALIENSDFTSPIEYLREKHPHDSVFKPKWLEAGSVITPKFLLDKIMNTTECESGFVTVRANAKECVDDEVSKLFGFCLQKSSPSLDDLGPEAITLAKEVVGRKLQRMSEETQEAFENRLTAAAKKYLSNRLKTKFTLTRKSFKRDQCIPVAYFKFLAKYRNIIPSVEILHYIHYEGRYYSDKFMRHLLQSRHNLIRNGLGKSLAAKNDKCLSCCIYGGTLMEACKYSKFTYAMDTSFACKSHTGQRQVTATDINLLGAVPSKNGEFDLMYLMKYNQESKQITNLLQVGATILGYSRAIFYYQIFSLLNILDSRRAQLCYLDTGTPACLNNCDSFNNQQQIICSYIQFVCIPHAYMRVFLYRQYDDVYELRGYRRLCQGY